MGQAISEIFPPKPRWLPENMPDMTGKVAVVTGGNTGIGKVTCKYLLLKNAKVYLFCRSESKALAAIADLKQQTGKEALFVSCDLSDLSAIKACAEEFLAKEQRLDVLFCNAGVMMCPMDMLTKQGYDMQFGTNVLGHAYLTLRLLPLLQTTAKSFGQARIVTTSSNGHLGAPSGGFSYATLRDGPARKKLSTTSAYFQSKWGDVVWCKELARRYGKDGIVSTSLNPGAIKSELQRYMSAPLTWLVKATAYDADPYGAITQLYAGTAPEAQSLNGQYLIPWARPATARKDTEDEAAGKALWEWIQEQVKDF
ncbi:NADP-binding protein [Dacryopinax primogenitus]|uniref:NADP-binding protein n=1 Tax=Dacryopinax primogenitus (strain DJM 731) TaxID=1858805 RepID=M5G2N6_DACPD|nr:NADP-binding protein [Dacryopinax primogenitus]EJU00112.1 NADP-binding protein [Dacryopinax primogenitus]